MASKIGRPGTNPGPGRTSAKGARSSGNLGRTTGMTKSSGLNKDASKGIARTRIISGPGGSTRP